MPKGLITTKTTKFVKKAPMKKVVKKVSKALVKTVKTLIHNNVETKTQSLDSGFNLFNSGIAASGDVLRLIPTIGQGTDSGSRVGQSINLKSLRVKGHMILDWNNYGDQPNESRIAVRMMVVEARQFSFTADSIINYNEWTPYLLQNGTTEQPFNGDIKDLYLDIARTTCKVHHDEIIYLDMPQHSIFTPFGGTVVTTEIIAPMRTSCAFFDVNVKCKGKKLKYNDQSGDVGMNWAPVILFGFAHLNGSGPDLVNTPLGIQYVSTLAYDDA